MRDKTRIAAIVAASLGGMTALRLARRPTRDPAHAPGHRHLGPAPDTGNAKETAIASPRNQPWVRRSHSDSQQRRFRR
jgi:hypothetical protein